MHTHNDVQAQPLMSALARPSKRRVINPASLRNLAAAGLLAAGVLGAYTLLDGAVSAPVNAPVNAPAVPGDASVPRAYENLIREQQRTRSQRRPALSTAGQGSTLPGYLETYLQFVGDD